MKKLQFDFCFYVLLHIIITNYIFKCDCSMMLKFPGIVISVGGYGVIVFCSLKRDISAVSDTEPAIRELCSVTPTIQHRCFKYDSFNQRFKT